eukprot:TRINITY_DN1731_c2_g1_i1.p5 TRINITY_DN1731_c2_g1~~TRINITY_DN1731_c2_g1_i1.p5  ORF type:complete len:119 (-),score=3.98 TRINITY_DN1731_c2_g1_i1:118-474(-)
MVQLLIRLCGVTPTLMFFFDRAQVDSIVVVPTRGVYAFSKLGDYARILEQVVQLSWFVKRKQVATLQLGKFGAKGERSSDKVPQCLFLNKEWQNGTCKKVFCYLLALLQFGRQTNQHC